MDESIRFYTELLGMKLLDRAKIPTTKGETSALQSPGSQLVLELLQGWKPIRYAIRGWGRLGPLRMT